MPEDLKRAIVEAIAASGDDNYKRLLMLLLRVEEMFIERVDALAEQMTVPADRHAEDHRWITAARQAEGGVRSVAARVAISVIEKGALIGAGVLVSKFTGV